MKFFNVPQFVDIEDTIIGPLTLKQFFILVGGGMTLILLWWLFELWFVILAGVPIALILLAIVFVKIGGQPFPRIFLSWLSYRTKPKLYVWKKLIPKPARHSFSKRKDKHN